MAFHKNLVKEWYQDLSIKDLEEKYYALQKDYYFEDKDKQIKYMISTFLDASHNVNTNSTKTGIEELLKEKTGKDYQLKVQIFEISVEDLIDYIDKYIVKNSKQNLSDFFGKVDLRNLINENELDDEADVEKEWEGEKLHVLFCLLQDKKMLIKFISDIKNVNNGKNILKDYVDWAENFFSMNRIIG